VARLGIALVAVLALVLLGIYALGGGWFAGAWHAGTPHTASLPANVVGARSQQQAKAARRAGVPEAKRILFGDLHVHSTFSADAFQLSLPLTGGDGAHPVADACDFARYCAGLDFWSINDHAITLTPRRWNETVETMRQCNAVDDDVTAYLGWEWTQVGTRPENHYGHKNVIFRDLAEVPSRPIAAGPPPDEPSLVTGIPSTFTMGLLALSEFRSGGRDVARYLAETVAVPPCPSGVPVRDLDPECAEQAATPKELFAKLDDWGFESMVIPHGTTWGLYTPAGSSWDKQLAQQDPRQSLIEVYSGHGNSEEFRPWREVVFGADGARSCPKPTRDYLPSCWRAGEIIEERCLAEGGTNCDERAARARQHFVDADRQGGPLTVPGARPEDWQDAGQCRDCFQPSFNYRPRSSVQYILGLGFRFGFIASSDNHSARPGTGYKEIERTRFTEARFGNFPKTVLGAGPESEPIAMSEAFDDERTDLPVFAIWEVERGASFFLNGGLVAAHSSGSDRNAIWDALDRKEVYGTSGPRILLWFHLVNGPEGAPVAMGGEAALAEAPIFEVRAVGSLDQQPGCPDYAVSALGPDDLERVCRGECYHPAETRRPITRIEVVRIRPDGEIDDPWRVLQCRGDAAGCHAFFTDDEFRSAGRSSVYYVRAIEAESPAVDADPLHCERDESGRCVRMAPCFDRPDDDDCLADTEQRAWSSPIFVDYAG
jgi:hypothetical protein